MCRHYFFGHAERRIKHSGYVYIFFFLNKNGDMRREDSASLILLGCKKGNVFRFVFVHLLSTPSFRSFPVGKILGFKSKTYIYDLQDSLFFYTHILSAVFTFEKKKFGLLTNMRLTQVSSV